MSNSESSPKIQEIYRTIPDYPNYQVSNLGNIKSLNYRRTKEVRYLTPTKDSVGYLTVYMKGKTHRVHVLVAIVFLKHKPCKYKYVVNHKDFNKLNNQVENLEIVTNRENSNKKHIKSSSDYVGVGFHKAANKWMSRIRINGKTKYLGLFTNELEASNEYKTALRNLLK